MSGLSNTQTSSYGVFRREAQVPVTIFVICGTRSLFDIQKSVDSINELEDDDLNVYLVDNSNSGESTKFIADALSIKYISSNDSARDIHDKIASVDTNTLTISIEAGEIVTQQMLIFKRSITPKTNTQSTRKSSTIDNVQLSNYLSDDYHRNIKLLYAKVSALFLSLFGKIKRTMSSVVARFRRSERGVATYLQKHNRSLQPNRSIKATLVATLAVLLLMLPVVYVVTTRNMSEQAVNSNAGNGSASSSGSTQNEDKPTSDDPNIVNPDKSEPRSATFTIEPGDSMSSIITDYINDMHAAFPSISLARLGYAQDKLMNTYGYKPLPNDQSSFTVAAEDVKAAWNTADQADDWEDFWSDYAVRAGIKW